MNVYYGFSRFALTNHPDIGTYEVPISNKFRRWCGVIEFIEIVHKTHALFVVLKDSSFVHAAI